MPLLPAFGSSWLPNNTLLSSPTFVPLASPVNQGWLDTAPTTIPRYQVEVEQVVLKGDLDGQSEGASLDGSFVKREGDGAAGKLEKRQDQTSFVTVTVTTSEPSTSIAVGTVTVTVGPGGETTTTSEGGPTFESTVYTTTSVAPTGQYTTVTKTVDANPASRNFDAGGSRMARLLLSLVTVGILMQGLW